MLSANSQSKGGDDMEALTNFIFSDSAEFTPQSLVAYMGFVLILSCISSLVENALSINRR